MNLLYSTTPTLLQGLARLILRPLLFHFAKLDVRGIHNIPNNKTVILAPNHTNEIDPVLLAVSFPWFSKITPIFYVSNENGHYKEQYKDKLQSKVYGGIFFKLMGAYPIKRKQKDYEKSLGQHLELLRNKKTLCVFPEGKLTKYGGIQKAHGGVVYLAEKTGSVIIPVSITGTWNFNFKDLFLKKIAINIKFGRELYSYDILNYDDGKERYKIAAERIMNIIRKDMSLLNE